MNQFFKRSKPLGHLACVPVPDTIWLLYAAIYAIRTWRGMLVLSAGLSQIQMRGHRRWAAHRCNIAESTPGAPLRGKSVSRQGTTTAYTSFLIENKVVPS